MKVIVIIPARSGSKSLKNKNILTFKGKPLLCHSISYGLKSKLVDKVVVSTDSKHFSNIAEACGANVPFIRPRNLALDNTQDYPVMKHALDYFESIGEVYDVYILLRPTSPLRPQGLIEKAIHIIRNKPSLSSIRTIAKIKQHPFRAWEINKNGSMSGFVQYLNEPYNLPRQELPELYFQTGDLEAIRRDTLLNGSVSGKNIFPIIMGCEEVYDIDNESDFERAEKS